MSSNVIHQELFPISNSIDGIQWKKIDCEENLISSSQFEGEDILKLILRP